MEIEKPKQSKPQEDGVYLAMVESAEETKSIANPNAKQIKFSLTLNNRQRTAVWVNQSTKGIEQLYQVGLAEDTPDGRLVIKESNHLVGVIITRGRGLLTPATTATKMNPVLEPLFNQVALRASYK